MSRDIYDRAHSYFAVRAFAGIMLLVTAALAMPAFAADNGARAKTEVAVIKAIAPDAAISCFKNADGETFCKADDHILQLRGCGDGGFYGRIAADSGVDLSKTIDGHGKATAHLKKGQFVCSAVTAVGDDQSQEFVVAVDTSSVPDCKGNELCKNADFPIEWKGPKPVGKCDPNAPPSNGYPGCAAGWIENSDLDGYSMGLKELP
jgi:hypothetical protein